MVSTPPSTLGAEEPVYEELYDLMADPFETENLAPSGEYRDRIDSMRRRILELGRDARVDERPPKTLPV